MSQKVIKNTIYYTIGEVIPRILSFLLLPILTTCLTPAEYGMNSYITSVMTFVLVIATLALNSFLLRNYFQTKDEIERKELVGSVFLFILLFNILIMGLQILVFPLFISHFKINIPFHPYFLLAILNNFFDVIAIIPLVLFRVKENAKGFLITSLSQTLLQYVLIYVLVVIFKKGLEGSFYGRLIVNIPFFFLYLYLMWKNAILKIKPKLIKQGLKFSLPLLPGALSYLFVSLSDRVILERYISLDKIGIYSVALTLALALNIIIQALYKTFEPMLFKEFPNDNFQDTNIKLFRIYLFALFSGAFATALFSKEFFGIITSGVFKAAYKIVPFLVISVVISGINTYYNILMIASKKTILVSSISILAGVVSVILNFVFIPHFGYYGAILASATSFLMVNLILQYNIVINKRYLMAQLFLMILIVISPLLFDGYLDTSFVMSLVCKSILFVLFVLIAYLLLGLDFKSISERFFSKNINF